MTYKFDSVLRGPEELGSSGGIPADWHIDFVNRDVAPSNYVCVQFGSEGVTREMAQAIANRMLAGLNSEAAS